MHVLVVEDDRETAHFLQKALKESGHGADLAEDGETGQSLAEQGVYDVLIVDRMLPRLDGLSLIRDLRKQGRAHAGADPFGAGRGRRPREGPAGRRRRLSDEALRLSELLARVEALARRAVAARRRRRAIAVGDLMLDRLSHAGHARRRADPRCSRASSGCSSI